MKDKIIDSMSDAGRFVADILSKRGYTQIKPHLVNKGRHIILEAVAPRTGYFEVYYLLYKRDLFHTYSNQFTDSEQVLGESINIEYYKAIRRSQKLTGLLIAYPNGYVYNVPLKELHEYYDTHYRLRTQNITHEITFSFPINLLNRWDKAWTCQDLNIWINHPSLNDKIKELFRKIRNKLFPDHHDIKE